MYPQNLTSTQWNIWRSILSAWALLLCIGLATSVASADALPEGASSPSASPVTSCPIGGSIVPSPNTAPNPNYLNDVDVISANNVWAVGSYGSFYNNWSNTNAKTLTMRWEGAEWNVVPSPNLGLASVLHGVSAVSANDVWAVGCYSSNASGPCNGTLIMHWDGTRWSQVSAPGDMPLYAVAAVSSNDVWAVGGGSYYTLTLHWDGTRWSRVSSPSTYALNGLYDVAAISANDVWAVGYTGYYDGIDPNFEQVVLRWNGTQWSRLANPSPGFRPVNSLSAVSATSASDVWVVGHSSGSTGIQPVIGRWNGSRWDSFPVPCSVCSLVDVKSISTDDVWAVASNGWQSFAIHWDGTAWSMTSTPPGGPLNAVDASGPDSVWAVGGYGDIQSGVTHNFVLRWNGTQWSTVASPNVDFGYNTLRAVEVLSPNDIWAVGHAGVSASEGTRVKTMIQHWDGTRWSVVPSPNEPSGTDNYLYDISAVSANDIWAVGYYHRLMDPHRSVNRALAMHWDGIQWSLVPVPSFLGCTYPSNPLSSVKAISANDVWAVGHQYCDSPVIVNTGPIHWDGQQWTRGNGLQWSPSDRARLLSIDGISSNDLWAVGEYTYGNTNPYETFIVHWNGQRWSRVPSPNVGTDNNRLKGVTAIAANDVWAVGYSGPPGAGHALALHWDGTEWSVVPTPDIGESSYFLGVGSSATGEVWAVGNYINGGVPHTLVERWDGSRWEVVSSPSPSTGNNYLWSVAPVPGDYVYAVGDYKAGLAQHTLVERFSTATFTPFSDVPEGSTFYAPIRCLTCRGILSGYADGTFRPNNDVTRGQLSKIVSNSANFQEDPGPQIFEDVPPGSTFYDWVQRLARRGHISGYPCGSPGEPCISGNKPYFRPNANATRAQISKIVSNARGYNDPAGAQIFEDVPPTHGFYEWIQRLARHGAMGGYECGGAGEPCGAERRPYFRPQNNATRGQTSKIVSNTFFPECAP